MFRGQPHRGAGGRGTYSALAAAWILVLLAAGCGRGDDVPPSPALAPNAPAVQYTYEILHAWPHDHKAFTQGLLYHDGVLYESTGMNGESSLRKVELESGKVMKNVPIPAQYFAEGLTLLNGKLYQLTWQSH